MKRTRKTKLSLGLKIASVLTCIALLSVGFASWLIVNDPEDKTATGGSITAYTVSDATVALTATDSDTTIIFGKPAEIANDGWFRAGSDVAEESLDATVAITATPTNVTNYTLTVKLEGTETAHTTALLNAIAKNYITVTLEVGENTATITSATDDNGIVLTCSPMTEAYNGNVEITFGWGSAFAVEGVNSNPYFYINDLEQNSTNEATARNLIAGVFALNNISYKLTVSATMTV